MLKDKKGINQLYKKRLFFPAEEPKIIMPKI